MVLGTIGVILNSRVLAVSVVILTVVCGLLAMQLRCPRCGQRVFWRPLILDSHIVGYWSPLIPKHCLQCELPL